MSQHRAYVQVSFRELRCICALNRMQVPFLIGCCIRCTTGRNRGLTLINGECSCLKWTRVWRDFKVQGRESLGWLLTSTELSQHRRERATRGSLRRIRKYLILSLAMRMWGTIVAWHVANDRSQSLTYECAVIWTCSAAHSDPILTTVSCWQRNYIKSPCQVLDGMLIQVELTCSTLHTWHARPRHLECFNHSLSELMVESTFHLWILWRLMWFENSCVTESHGVWVFEGDCACFN